MTIEQIIDGLIVREGRTYTNRAADKGGPTRFGITAKTLGDWRKLGRPATPEEVAALEEPEARAIYEHEYVIGPKFDRIADERLKVLLVDIGVNSGQVTAVMMLQEALGVPVDGVLGPQTLGTAAARPTAVADLIRVRIERYLELALDTPAVVQFKKDHPQENLSNLRGWIRRAASFAA